MYAVSFGKKDSSVPFAWIRIQGVGISCTQLSSQRGGREGGGAAGGGEGGLVGGGEVEQSVQSVPGAQSPTTLFSKT